MSGLDPVASDSGRPYRFGHVSLREYFEQKFAEFSRSFDRYIDEHRRRHELDLEELEKRAADIRDGLDKALAAVAEQAGIHAISHQKEHAGHERIHEVEKRAVDKAEVDMTRRLEGMNEFRAQMRDQAGMFITRDVFDARLESVEREISIQVDALGKRVESIELAAANFAGRLWAMGAVLGIVIVVVNIAVAVLVR